MKISAVVLTKNEGKNIKKCVESVLWCDEIVIIDDYSTDQTFEIIRKLKLKNKKDKEKFKIYQNNLEDDFATQRNFGLEKVTGDWVLFVDADEVISEELKSEIQKTLQKHAAADICKGYFIRRKDYFGGRWLKYGETGSIKFIRLAKKDTGKWEGRVHEIWNITGEKKELKNPILHYPHQTIADFLQDINKYTDIVVQCWKEEGERIRFWEIIVYPAGKFLQNYILKLGFLDSLAGFVMAVFMSFHSFLARSKYWMLTHQKFQISNF